MMSLGEFPPRYPPTVISFGTDTNIYLLVCFAAIPILFVSYMYLHYFPIGWTVFPIGQTQDNK